MGSKLSEIGSVIADAQGRQDLAGIPSRVRESRISAAIESMSVVGSRSTARRNVRVIGVARFQGLPRE